MKKINYQYFKKPTENFDEITLIRLTFIENSEDWDDTEILVVGYIFNTNLPFGVYNLKFSRQKMLEDSDFKILFLNFKNHLKEIDENEFRNLYYETGNSILADNNENKRWPAIKIKNAKK